MKFIIEHLEPQLYEWCLIEYEHISKIVGKKNLFFTNISEKMTSRKSFFRLNKLGKVHTKKFSEIASENFFHGICLLSQFAKNTLKTTDKRKFQYFVFGGILGDAPAKKRTNVLINKLKKSKINFETRNLGSKQMPTDVAVYVTKMILDGKKFNEIKFFDNVEIEINENESVILPFRYVIDGNKLIISEKLV